MASHGRGGGGGGGNGDKWKPAWLLELVLAIPAMSSRKPLLVACVGDRWVWEVVGMWRGGEGWGVGGGGSAVQPQHEQAAGIGVSPLFAGVHPQHEQAAGIGISPLFAGVGDPALKCSYGGVRHV
ncbi:hypothetical protein E2562_024475 [Oryza meyeriana var. granulata]|uniref:Uncharacterized protein n=1 Tax=Oryza meyeriana var. granulata TaxID=110450 RepID=A0A6G1FBT0_9ORYZ|nr:hypothetical protein E2562_024475 [Oryza meyeriana var. granulata]